MGTRMKLLAMALINKNEIEIDVNVPNNFINSFEIKKILKFFILSKYLKVLINRHNANYDYFRALSVTSKGVSSCKR